MNNYEVRCNRCNWCGLRRDLHLEFGCPACLSDKWLEYEDCAKLRRAVLLSERAELRLKTIIEKAREAISVARPVNTRD